MACFACPRQCDFYLLFKLIAAWSTNLSLSGMQNRSRASFGLAPIYFQYVLFSPPKQTLIQHCCKFPFQEFLRSSLQGIHPRPYPPHPAYVRLQPDTRQLNRQLCRRLSDAWGSVPEERSPARRRCRSSLSFSCSHPPLFKFVICLRSIQTLKIAKCSCMYSIQYFFCFLKPTIRSRGQAYLYADGTEKPGRNDSSRASNTCGYIQ